MCFHAPVRGSGIALRTLPRPGSGRGRIAVNDFGGQEPGSEQRVSDFCRLTYGVQFPMFARTRVTGAAADPLNRYLAEVSGDAPRWNFHKYLLDRQGRVVASFPGEVAPDDQRLIVAIEALL